MGMINAFLLKCLPHLLYKPQIVTDNKRDICNYIFNVELQG